VRCSPVFFSLFWIPWGTSRSGSRTSRRRRRRRRPWGLQCICNSFHVFNSCFGSFEERLQNQQKEKEKAEALGAALKKKTPITKEEAQAKRKQRLAAIGRGCLRPLPSPPPSLWNCSNSRLDLPPNSCNLECTSVQVSL